MTLRRCGVRAWICSTARRRAATSAFVAALTVHATAAHTAPDAEFAVRWDPAEGGPATLDAVLNRLSLPQGAAKQMVVQYFSVPQPPELPAGFAAIARERASGAQIESTYKVRGPAPLLGDGEKWTCPLAPPAKSKSEVDVSVLSSGAVRKSYSRSCSVERSMAESLPKIIHAQPLGCTSSVRRVRAGDVKVELWELSGGNKAIEVSWTAKDTPADLQAFRSRIVAPLVSSGVKPLSESKTELGSIC